MKCPECNSANLKVTDSRHYDEGILENTKRRKRVCKDCQHAFTSFEICYPKEELERVLKALNQKRWKAHWSDEEDRMLIKLHKENYSLSSIAAHLGRTYEAIRKRVQILGIAD